MLKNYPPSFCKAVLTLLIALTLYSSCTKGYDPGNLLDEKASLLTGKPESVNWSLSTIRVNNAIDTSARGTVKVYRADGTFTDKLGYTGYWTLQSRDSLIESTRSGVNPDAPYFTNRFHIDHLERGRLQLTYMDGDKTIRLNYESNR